MTEEKQTTPDAEEKQTIPNIVTIEDSGPCKKKIIVEIPEEKIKDAMAEQYSELKKDAVLPGFRKGRAPMRLIEKRFGSDVTQQVKLKLLADASDAAIKDNQIDVLGDPDIDHENIELPDSGPMKFEFEAEVRPDFDLPELENIPVEKPKVEVTDAKIAEELENLRKRMGIFQPVEGKTVEEGDQAVVDVKVKTEGIDEVDKHDNLEISIRENGFVAGIPVEDLPKVLKGAKRGDTKTANVEMPKTFYKEELRGKKIELQIEVKEVKQLQLAELDEDFFRKFGVADEAELKERIKEAHEEQAERDARQQMADQIYEYLLENTDFDMPESIVADQAQRIAQRQYSQLLMQNTDSDTIKEKMQNLQASSQEQATEQMKLFFVMDKIAEKLEVEVSPEEINGHIAQIAVQQGRRPEKMREELARDGSLAQFTLQVREQKCIEKMLETAKVTEVAEVKKTEKKKADKKTPAKKAARDETSEKRTAPKKKTSKKKTDE